MNHANLEHIDTHRAGAVLLHLLKELTEKCPNRKFTARELTCELKHVCDRTDVMLPLELSLMVFDGARNMPGEVYPTRIVNRI